MSKDKYIISRNSTIKDALKQIEFNKEGFVLIENSKNQILAVATDGDIRSGLLKGVTLNDLIDKVGNKNFFLWFKKHSK